MKIRSILALSLLLFLSFSSFAQKSSYQWSKNGGEYQILLKEKDAWETIRMKVTMPADIDGRIGFILNYVNRDNYNYLSIENEGERIRLDMGRHEFGFDRLAERREKDGYLQKGHEYELRIYHAPKIDKEDWRQWKFEVTDLTIQEQVLKESVENDMSFFGLGKIGAITDDPRMQVYLLERTVYQPDLGNQSFKIARIFADGMILQQGKPVPVWGTASPGTRVVVEINDFKGMAVADSKRKWRIVLPEMKAVKKIKMYISNRKDTVVIKDIAVGDVWLASGQSNMGMRAWQSDVADHVTPSEHYEYVRIFMEEPWPSSFPLEDPFGRWIRGSQQDILGASAVALSFAVHQAEKSGIPIGILQSAVGGTGVESWVPFSRLENIPGANEMLDKYRSFGRQLQKREVPSVGWPEAWYVPGQSHAPGYLYNGMIYPLRDVPIKGFLWYQGESNAGRSGILSSVFPQLIDTWRSVWGDSLLPFLSVQLAGYDGRLSGNEIAGEWPNIRDIQRRVANNKTNSLMVSAFDLGDSTDIHPRSKWQLGIRLSYAALYLDEKENVVGRFSGPDMKKVEMKGNKAIITYKQGTASFAEDPGAIGGFMAAGEDQFFYPAAATVLADGTIEIKSNEVPDIMAVRYGWENFPVKSNLRNRQGLAAIPFRTDEWKTGNSSVR